jgi:hypothetical protein
MKFTVVKILNVVKGVLLFVIVISLLGCVSKDRERKLLTRIAELETELDDCKFGEEKMHAQMLANYDEGDYSKCKSIYLDMKDRHPESLLFPEVKDIFDKIIQTEKEEELEKQRMEKAEKEKKLASLKKLRKKYDDVSNITWYRQPYFTHYNNTNSVSLYIGQTGTSYWLRLKMSYEGDNWIFFERAYLSYDGNTREIVFDRYDDKKSDNDGGRVWEWIDISVSSDLLSYLREFSKSGNCKMRLSGKYSKTHNLTWNERQGIRDVLAGFDALNDF